jgi:hydroxymethylpyrimidine/phosphomethylpyrimidine kinase
VTRRPKVLVIAGSDSSGGAGLLRDVQVLAEFGVDAACAITAVTAQSHRHVESACILSPDLVRQQICTALQSGPVDAIKIGMLGNRAIVEAVLQVLPERERMAIVVDPVLFSSSGARLLDSEGLQALHDRLLPRCTLVTPNLMEAAAMLGQHVAMTEAARLKQAEALLLLGPTGVLLKGGHAMDGDALDVLATASAAPLWLRAERLDANLRGTGCALSSAIAALLALGVPMAYACQRAKEYVFNKLMAVKRADLSQAPLSPLPRSGRGLG